MKWPFQKKTQVNNNTPSTVNVDFGIYAPEDKNKIAEKLKGKEKKKQTTITPEELGEEHIFDLKDAEITYRKEGLAYAAVEKYVDYVWGPGFTTKSVSPQAKQIIDDWIQDVAFFEMGREWVREAVMKGTGYMELGGNDENEVPDEVNVLDPVNIWIKRDENGRIEEYNQFIGKMERFKKDEVTSFKPFQIAHVTIGKSGDCPYGIGIIYPADNSFFNLVSLRRNMNLLLHRKANSPYVAKVGSLEHNNIPTQGEVENFGKKFEWLNNKHEWTVGPNVEIKALDFGNLSEKFMFPLQYYTEDIFTTFQIPEVLMGRSVNLAVAPVQMDAWERRAVSIQEDFEKVIEDKIFRRVLNANGIDAHVEIEWNQPSLAQKHERLKIIRELLASPSLSKTLATKMELQVAKLLEIDLNEAEEDEIQRDREQNEPQPRVPGQNQPQAGFNDFIFQNIDANKDYELKEWLGFNFEEYLEAIQDAIQKDNFELLLATTPIELEAGRLTEAEINKIRKVLSDGFANGRSINQIAKDMDKKVTFRDLFRMKDGEILTSKDGSPQLALSKDMRSIAISRSETTRLAANGALKHFSDGGVKNVTFVATPGARTCPTCLDLDGQVFEISKAPGIIPVHALCRCTWVVTSNQSKLMKGAGYYAN